MAQKKVREVPQERAATQDEVRTAIDALSKTDWYRLLQFAEYHVFLLGELAGDRRAPDVLNEAFTRLLERSRKWDKSKVHFRGLLYGAIRSIASSWRRKAHSPTENASLAASLITENDEGELSDPAEEFQSTAANPAQMLIYKQTLAEIDALFVDDPKVRMVIEALAEGYDPPAIRDLWEFSQEKYNAIILRMRRHLKKAGITDPTRERHHVQ
jgi:hypothetical protein